MDEQATREMTPEEICHDVRKKIDAIIQQVGYYKNDTRPERSKGKRELALVYTKLQQVKMLIKRDVYKLLTVKII